MTLTVRPATGGGVLLSVKSIPLVRHLLAVLDQVVVSGTAFVSAVLVGRWCGPSELGRYKVVLSALGTLLALQTALILLPYAIQRHRKMRAPAVNAGIALLQNTILAGAVTAALGLAAAVALVAGADTRLSWLMFALVLAAPFALQREFSRYYAFAHLDVAKALMLDLAVAALQITALGWLRWTDRLSAFGACAALGGACALASAVWLYQERANFILTDGHLREVTTETWTLARWFCAGQIAYSVQCYASYWLLPLQLGMAQTGVYAACEAVASLANPLVTAFRNLLTPRSVLAFKDGGHAGLRRQAMRDALLLAGGMSIFCLVIFASGEAILRLLFHTESTGAGHVVTVLAAAMMASAVGSPASYALAGMERPRTTAGATSLGAVVTVITLCILSSRWGLPGAAYGFLAGSVVASVARWAAFLTVFARSAAHRDHFVGAAKEKLEL